METKREQLENKRMMQKFLQFLNSKTDTFILTGTASYSMCYGMPLYRYYIDLDGDDISLLSDIIVEFCKANNLGLRVSRSNKHVDSWCVMKNNTMHFMIVPHNTVSERPTMYIEEHDGIRTYNINYLAMNCVLSYANNCNVENTYNLVYIINNYFNFLNADIIQLIICAFEKQRTHQMANLLRFCIYENIDRKKLVDDLAEAFKRLGINTSLNHDSNIS